MGQSDWALDFADMAGGEWDVRRRLPGFLATWVGGDGIGLGWLRMTSKQRVNAVVSWSRHVAQSGSSTCFARMRYGFDYKVLQKTVQNR